MAYGRHLVDQLVGTNRTVLTDELVDELRGVAIANNTTVDNVAFLFDGAVLTGQEYLRVASEEKTYITESETGERLKLSGTVSSIDIENNIITVDSVDYSIIDLTISSLATNTLNFKNVDSMVSGVGLVEWSENTIGSVCSTGSMKWKQVSYTSPMTLDNFSTFSDINLDDFGAVGDYLLLDGSVNPSPTDDSDSIQEAIKYACLANQAKIVANSTKAYYTTKTIYIPTIYRSYGDDANKLETITVIDLSGCKFYGTGNVESGGFACFESAYIDANGDLQSTIGTSNEYYLTTGTEIVNVNLNNYYQGFKLQGWVHGCSVRNIFCNNVGQAVWANRCFYTHFEKIICRGTYIADTARFYFYDESNIQPIKGCITGACDIGFEFAGKVEALRLVDCGMEGFTQYGVVTKGQFNIKFDSCYFETNETGAIGYTGDSLINHVTFDNCWGFGSDLAMLGDFASNVNVTILPNNVLGSNAVWFKSLPDYTLSDFNFSNALIDSGTVIDEYDAPSAINVNGTLTIYNADTGPSAIVGKVSQTSEFHPQKVNGRYSEGFSSVNREGVGYSQTISDESAGYRNVTFATGIKWSDTQNIYVALRVAHNSGSWTFFGNIYGDNIVTHYEVDTGISGSLSISQDSNSNVVITSPNLPVATGNTVSIVSGEIRLL